MASAAELCSINFDSLAPSDDELLANVLTMAGELAIPEKLGKTVAEMTVYFKGCKDKMRQNPFHDWHHVFDVTQFCFTMLKTTGLSEVLAAESIIGIFLAAIAHDLDHRGKSNAYEINAKTELAQQHPGKAPLEAHHTALALELLGSSGILSHLEPPKKALVMAVVKDCIMATDMGKHGEIMKLCAIAFGSADFDPKNYYSVELDGDGIKGPGLLLLKLLIKGSDISNPARPMAVASQWNDKCYEEFYSEGDEDRKKGRKLNPLHDRENNSIPKSSVGFIGFVVAPIYVELQKFMVAAVDKGEATLKPDSVQAILVQLDANKTEHQQNAAKSFSA